MASVPLVKALTAAVLGSRREMTAAIKKGRVAVNGVTATGFSQPFDPETDELRFDNRAVTPVSGYVYIMLNKPVGVLSVSRDNRGRRTVTDCLPPKYRQLHLYPAGRLDKDSSGLILLSNDGELTQRLTHPRFGHEKEYIAETDARLEAEYIRQLEKGLMLSDGPAAPAVVREISGTRPYRYNIIMREGRKRQLRRMLVSLGVNVLKLERIRLGPLQLGKLAHGQMRELTAAELKRLKPSGR